jgi:TfoX/Sxy family transcriptional regulator of competence genes
MFASPPRPRVVGGASCRRRKIQQSAAVAQSVERRLPKPKVAGSKPVRRLMAYDEDLANRLRELLAQEDRIAEKKMFGGLAFLLNGNMSVAASSTGGLLVRVDPADSESCLARPHASLMEMRGRTMEGWIMVAPEGLKTKRELEAWVKRGISFAKTLPAK